MQRLETEGNGAITTLLELEKDLSAAERELLREILAALRVIRYGSVVLTVHDGHIVEVQKTERIRRGTGKQS